MSEWERESGVYGKYECVSAWKYECINVCGSKNLPVFSGFINMIVCEGGGIKVIITMNVFRVKSVSQRSKYDCVNVQVGKCACESVYEHWKVPK